LASTARAILIDREELEHRVAVRLCHEGLHRSVLVRAKVRSGGRGHADIALEHRSGLLGWDLADGIVTPVAAAAQVTRPAARALRTQDTCP
jgi:hypothetical protein